MPTGQCAKPGCNNMADPDLERCKGFCYSCELRWQVAYHCSSLQVPTARATSRAKAPQTNNTIAARRRSSQNQHKKWRLGGLSSYFSTDRPSALQDRRALPSPPYAPHSFNHAATSPPSEELTGSEQYWIPGVLIVPRPRTTQGVAESSTVVLETETVISFSLFHKSDDQSQRHCVQHFFVQIAAVV